MPKVNRNEKALRIIEQTINILNLNKETINIDVLKNIKLLTKSLRDNIFKYDFDNLPKTPDGSSMLTVEEALNLIDKIIDIELSLLEVDEDGKTFTDNIIMILENLKERRLVLGILNRMFL